MTTHHYHRTTTTDIDQWHGTYFEHTTTHSLDLACRQNGMCELKNTTHYHHQPTNQLLLYTTYVDGRPFFPCLVGKPRFAFIQSTDRVLTYQFDFRQRMCLSLMLYTISLRTIYLEIHTYHSLTIECHRLNLCLIRTNLQTNEWIETHSSKRDPTCHEVKS